MWIEEQVKPGKVDWPAVQARLHEQGIVVVGGGADEAPEVYKRLPDVLAAHAGTIASRTRCARWASRWWAVMRLGRRAPRIGSSP